MKRLFHAVLLAAVFASVALVTNVQVACAAYTPPALKVGVIYSQDSQDWVDYYKRGYGILYKETKVYEYLESRGWDVEWISDDDLESLSKLQQYDAVVATYVFGMSPTASRTLTRYVAEGGGLVTLFASPRVAPGAGGSERDDHWVYILNHQGWEWGPPSEVYQTFFVDDVGAFKFVNRPEWGDPIVSGAASILRARGLADGDLSLWRNQSSGAWIEYVRTLKNNTNAVPFMKLSQLSAPTGSTNYSISSGPGAVRSSYLNGRSVYYYFSVADFVFNQDGSGEQTVPTGVKQSEIAGAYIESAINWVSQSGEPGVLVRDGRTNATVNVYQGGIYASQYVTNPGNVTVNGTLYFRIYNPAGRLVKSTTRYLIGAEPGVSGQRYSESYVTSRLESGLYRVEVEYVTSYPDYARHYVETAYVYRAQGEGIPTKPDAARSSGQVVFDPRIVRSAGADRYATSLEIANAAGDYPRDGGYVIIASGDGPDALVASSLAGVYDAPLVLTAPNALPSGTDTWLRQTSRGLRRAVIVGGEAVVSSAVENRLKQIFGSDNVERIAGADRYATSAEVAEELREELGDSYDGGMIVTNGKALADAAGASALAFDRQWPIVYVHKDAISEDVREVVGQIATGTPEPTAWIAGGTGVVASTVAADLDSMGVDVSRAAGTDRYDTAAKLADMASASGSKWDLLGMASGVKLADALCLGSYVGRENGVMLLTSGTSLTTSTKARITTHKNEIDIVSVAGGTAAVKEDACAAISSLLP